MLANENCPPRALGWICAVPYLGRLHVACERVSTIIPGREITAECSQALKLSRPPRPKSQGLVDPRDDHAWAGVKSIHTQALMRFISCCCDNWNPLDTRDGLPGAKCRSSSHHIVVGDSLTAGYQLPVSQAYPALLQQRWQDAGRISRSSTQVCLVIPQPVVRNVSPGC